MDDRSVRTNVIPIMVDEMGFYDVGCYGSEIGMPNLDSLTANGQGSA